MFCCCELQHLTDLVKGANYGDQWCKHMIRDIQMQGKQATRAASGIHCKHTGPYVGYLKACNKLSEDPNKVKKTKTKKNKYNGWTTKELKDQCELLEDDLDVALDGNVDLKDENEDLQNQVYHNACLSESGALLFDVLDVIGFVQFNNSGH